MALSFESQQLLAPGGINDTRDTGPALAGYCNVLYAAWRGSGTDSSIWFSRTIDTAPGNSSTWDTPFQIHGAATSHRPAIVGFVSGDSKLPYILAIWKGKDDDQRLFYALLDVSTAGTSWTTPEVIPNGATSAGPSLTLSTAISGQIIYGAWKGEGTDERLFWSTFYWNPFSGGWTWDFTPDEYHTIPGASSMGPSLQYYLGLVFAAWRGRDLDEGIWYSTYDGKSWHAQQNIPGTASSYGPSLAEVRGRLYAAWKGKSGDQSMWYTVYGQNGFGPIGTTGKTQDIIQGTASSIGPALVWWSSVPVGGEVPADGVLLAWKGIESDTRMWFTLGIIGST
jgi:hypothetical protein